MTIRRDLVELESRGQLVRVRGGAQRIVRCSTLYDREKDFQTRLGEHSKEKHAIGLAASRIIRDGQLVFLDGSSTCLHLASFLNGFNRLTVLTDSLGVTNTLSNVPGIELIVLGGSLQPDGNTIDGPLALDNIDKLTVEVVFFSCSGFDVDYVYNPGMIGTNIKRVLIKKAPKRVLLATSEKFGVKDFFSICSTRDVDVVVTDGGMNESSRQLLRSIGVDLLVAD